MLFSKDNDIIILTVKETAEFTLLRLGKGYVIGQMCENGPIWVIGTILAQPQWGTPGF